jgi:PAS domain S-box-containing protein
MAPISALVLVIAAGWRFGTLAGIAAGLLSLPCNILLYASLGVDWSRTMFAHGEAAAGTAGLMLIGGIIGHLHTLRARMLTELAERRRAEQELTRHRDQLDSLVRQRTAELEAANRQLLEDAEERKDALYELSATKEYLENVIGTSLDSIVITDSNGVIVRVNRALLDLIGCTKEELIGRKVDRLSEIEQGVYTTSAGETIEIGPDFLAASRAMNDRLYADGRISNWEYYLVSANGILIPVEENIILLTDSQGRGIGAVGILRDITHRRMTENELKRHRDHLNDLVQEKTSELSAVNEKLAASNRLLQESELVLKEAQHIAHLGSWERNFQTDTNYWSDEFFRILGYEPGQVKPGFDLFIEHIHPDDREMISSSRRDFDLSNPRQEREFRIITKSGATRHISSQIRADSDEAGSTVRIYGTLQDITERKRAEEELKKREIVLKDAQQLAHVGSWERDFVLNTNYWSDEYYRILGYAPREIEPTFEAFFSHIHPEDQDKFFSFHQTENVVSLDFRIIQKTGAERHVSALSKIDLNKSGMPERVHGVLADITERKRAEQGLLKYQNDLEKLVQERTAELEEAQRELVTKEKLSVLGRLTATVSHELRNPLGVIRSSIFFLQKKIQNPDEKIDKHLNRIEEQITVCDGIVDELLEYTRGRQSEVIRGDLNELLGEIRSLIHLPDGVKLGWYAAQDLPPVGFDRDKIKRVFINLVQNAIQAVTAKYEKDPAYAPCITVASGRENGGVAIQIQDNGIGMSEETARHAFEPLFTTRARGTGLGLSIVKKIVGEHDGRVTLQTEPGQGTTITVYLPAQQG